VVEVERAGEDAGGDAPLVEDVRRAFGDEAESGSSANVGWRLAYWRYVLRSMRSNPVLGVGFGKPAAFHWNGIAYDRRRGDPTDPHDVSPPHNSFVNLLFRMGLLGLLPLLALIAAAAWRFASALRAGSLSAFDRATLVGLAAIFVFIAVIASFNVALEGPFMGIFFWTVLGLLLLLPRYATERADVGGRSRP
jgi:O-antigen ligase